MPRKPREKSALCIHHVILRGINQQLCQHGCAGTGSASAGIRIWIWN